jgi:hypothetical protein
MLHQCGLSRRLKPAGFIIKEGRGVTLPRLFCVFG